MLSYNDQRVLDAATDLAATLGDNTSHTVAAAAMDTQGSIHTGVNVYHFTGGPCAEPVVLGVAASIHAGPLMTMVAVGDRGRSILPPCGRCRQMLLDLQPDCFVIVPTPTGPSSIPIRELLPHAYHHPDAAAERIVRFNSRYHDAIISGRKTSTIRYGDPVEPGPAWFVFEDDCGYRRLQGVVDDVQPRRLTALAHEGLTSLARLRQHYPDIESDALVHVVSFHLTDEVTR